MYLNFTNMNSILSQMHFRAKHDKELNEKNKQIIIMLLFLQLFLSYRCAASWKNQYIPLYGYLTFTVVNHHME